MYEPKRAPLDNLPAFMDEEHRAIADAINLPVSSLSLAVLSVEPKKKRSGMIVLADGTNWNPGLGEGFYGYRGGAWRLLG